MGDRIIACALTLLYALLFASAEPCADPIFDIFNATTSMDVPAFEYGKSNVSAENNALVISTAVKKADIPALGTSSVLQTFWLDTQPEVLTNITDLPYQGCILTLEGVETSSKQSAFDGNLKGCDGTFDSDCFRMLQYYANEATAFGARPPNTFDNACHNIANNLADKFSEACKNTKSWSIKASTPIFGTPSSCGDNFFDASANRSSLVTIESDVSKPDNFTNYDLWVGRTTPVFLTVFGKAFDSSQPQDWWWDSRLVCLKTDQIEQGSRSVESNGAGDQRRPVLNMLTISMSVAIPILFRWV